MCDLLPSLLQGLSERCLPYSILPQMNCLIASVLVQAVPKCSVFQNSPVLSKIALSPEILN